MLSRKVKCLLVNIFSDPDVAKNAEKYLLALLHWIDDDADLHSGSHAALRALKSKVEDSIKRRPRKK